MKLKNCVRNLFLAATDWICVYLFLCMSLYVYQQLGGKYSMMVCLKLLYVPFVVLFVNNISGLYGGHFFYPGVTVGKVEELKRLTLSISGGYILLFAYLGVTHQMVQFSRVGLGAAWFITLFAAPVFRYICRLIMGRYSFTRTRVLIAGKGKVGKMIARELQDDCYYGLDAVGFLDDRTSQGTCGKVSDAIDVAKKMKVDYLIVCIPPHLLADKMRDFLQYFRHVLVIPATRVLPIMWTNTFPVGSMAAFEINNRLQMRIFRFSKTAVEAAMAAVILPFILPLCLFIGLLVKLTSKGPALYRAERLGQDGKTIRIWKFRTMYQNADKALEEMLENNPDMKKEWERKFKLENDPRITPLGRILRKTSLDELPQFWNVLMGEMAIIGPRPIVEKERHYYGVNFQVFSIVKPGITGLWQVSGRSETSYEERVNLDLYYVSNWRIWMDYYILLKTVLIVLTRRGAC